MVTVEDVTDQPAPSKKSDNEEKDMTPEERLAWLRERGIQVTTPEERKAAQVAGAMKAADALSEEEVSYVLVPADRSSPLQELTFRPTLPGKTLGDPLVEHLKPAFKGTGEGVDLSLLQQAPLLAGDAPAVSDAALKQVAAEANVETFALVHPVPSNNFTAVNIYLDEIGLLKRLPLNTRASDYAKAAGLNPPPQFYGDVFLGRVEHQPVVRNVSFVLGADTAMDAPWLKAAAAENLEHQKEMNRITGRQDVQAATVGSDGKAKKEEGYSWTQSEEELEITVPLPKDAVSKDIHVKFHPQSTVVTFRKEPLLSLQLFERVDVDGGCTWTLDKSGADERSLIVTMEKVEQALWPRLLD